MVTQRSTRWLCTALDAALALLVIAAPLSGTYFWLTWPSAAINAESVANNPAPDATTLPKTELAWYAPLWQRDLAQPMVDPPAEVTTQPSRPTGPVPRLVATLIDSDSRYAHLSGQRGDVQLLEQNSVIDGYRIAAIESDRVQLQRGESAIWVEVPKERK